MWNSKLLLFLLLTSASFAQVTARAFVEMNPRCSAFDTAGNFTHCWRVYLYPSNNATTHAELDITVVSAAGDPQATVTNALTNAVINAAANAGFTVAATAVVIPTTQIPMLQESQITNLVTDLSGKAPTAHTHTESQVTNLTTDLAGKANSTHTHAESDVTNLVNDLAGKQASLGFTPVQKVASGTATFATTAITAGACSVVLTVAATGALTTDKAMWSFTSQPTINDSKLSGPYAWITAGNINFIRCNNTSASVTGTALVVNWMVTR